MPISGIGSWLPTIDEFLAHWAAVNTELGLPGLILLGGYDRSDLVTDRATVAGSITAVQSADNNRQTAAADRDVKRASVRPRFLQFGPAVRGNLPGTIYINALPRTPNFQDGAGKWRDRMDDMSSLWATINTNVPPVTGFTPPLLLAGGFAVAAFNTAATALSTAFTTLTNADQAAQLAREQRNDIFDPVYERLKQYRQAVLGTFDASHALIASLPRLSPQPGSTPAAVNLSGVWDPGPNMAHLVWSASTAPDLDHYEVRYHPGPKYKAAEEQFVDNVPAGTLEFDTNFGLPASGSSAWYKVYVVTTTLNEKGSNAVKVVRP